MFVTESFFYINIRAVKVNIQGSDFMPKQTYSRIMTQIQALQAQAEALRQRERVPALAEVVSRIREYGLTFEEIREALDKSAAKKGGRGRPAGAAKSAGGRGPRKSAVKGSTVAPKYRHPQTGQTWTGRGIMPKWLAQEVAAGRQRDEFLIAAAPAASPAAVSTAS
jgi:DNA-binding protein H-NS